MAERDFRLDPVFESECKLRNAVINAPDDGSYVAVPVGSLKVLLNDYTKLQIAASAPAPAAPSWDEATRGPRQSSVTGPTIYRYQMPVQERFTMELPAGARVIRVDCIAGLLWMWAVVDTEEPLVKRTFVAVKTGAPMPADPQHLYYIGFCALHIQMELGLYIFEDMLG